MKAASIYKSLPYLYFHFSCAHMSFFHSKCKFLSEFMKNNKFFVLLTYFQ
jgi:hypothetical protein